MKIPIDKKPLHILFSIVNVPQTQDILNIHNTLALPPPSTLKHCQCLKLYLELLDGKWAALI